MKKTRFTLTALLTAGIVQAGCGGGNKKNSGSNAVCNLTTDKSEINSGDEVRFNLKANFSVTTIKLDNIQMYDQNSGLDLSITNATPNQNFFEREFTLTVSEAKDVVAAVSSGGPEVFCSAPIKVKDSFQPDFSSDGEFQSLFDLTSTEIGQGQKQVVYKCTVPNEHAYTNIILQSHSQASCSIGVPQSEIATGQETLNEIPEEYLPNAPYGDRTPVLDGFVITKALGDQTDSAFTWNTGGSTIRWQGFTNYSDCHTSKAEMYYRERNNELKKTLLVWDHVQDPLSKHMIPKLRVSPDYPKGIHLRGAQAATMSMYFYCKWDHHPRNLVIPGIYQPETTGTFTATNSIKFDVDLDLNGEALSTHKNISYEDFRKISTALSVSENDMLRATISIKNSDNRILLSNDKSAAESSPELLDKWNKTCTGKTVDSIQVLKDELSTKDETFSSAVRLMFKLCDFSGTFETKTKKIETIKKDLAKHQVVVKCPVSALLSSQSASFVYTSSGDTRCDYGLPADDTSAENLIPKSYSKDGPLSETKPTIKEARLNNSAGVVHIGWSKLSMGFIGVMHCHKTKYEVRYKRDDQELISIVSFDRYFDDSNPNIGHAHTAQKWNLRSSQDLPTPAEIISVNDKKFSVYFYCDWYANEKIGEAVSPN